MGLRANYQSSIGRDMVRAVTGLTVIGAGVWGIASVANFFGRGSRAPRTLEPPAMRPDVRRITTADGALLNVHIYGPAAGQPVVLSHGWCERIDHWNPQINALAGEYRVIAFDHRGHGESALGARTPHEDVLADDLADVLTETVRPGERAVLVGHSMGGMTIMSWSKRHPEQADRAGAIVLTNTGYGSLVDETALIPMVGRILPRSFAVGFLSSPLPFPPGIVMRPLVKWRIMPSAGPAEVDFSTRMFKACPPHVRSAWGRALSCLEIGGPHPIPGVPTTVFAGELDSLTPVVHSHRIAAALKAAGTLEKFVVLPGVGHQGNLEAADVFNAELVRLAERVRAAGRTVEAAG